MGISVSAWPPFRFLPPLVFYPLSWTRGLIEGVEYITFGNRAAGAAVRADAADSNFHLLLLHSLAGVVILERRLEVATPSYPKHLGARYSFRDSRRTSDISI